MVAPDDLAEAVQVEDIGAILQLEAAVHRLVVQEGARAAEQHCENVCHYRVAAHHYRVAAHSE